mgnify:CR=1 FL=1
MSTVEFHATLHAALHYHVLSHLDLGDDAASIYDPNTEERDWVEGVLWAYGNAPGRLALQYLGIQINSLDSLREKLRYGSADTGLGDEAGRSLRAAFLAALDLERHHFSMAWNRDARVREQRLARAGLEMGEALTALRAELWKKQKDPPPLTVLDCPALGQAGRSVTSRGCRVVAVNLGSEGDQALYQILNEEVHLFTDAAVLEKSVGTIRDTRVNSEGYALHQSLEQAAVSRGRVLIQAIAPERVDAYEAWSERFGLPKA